MTDILNAGYQSLEAMRRAITERQEFIARLESLAALAHTPVDEFHLQWRLWFNRVMFNLVTWRESLDIVERRLALGDPLPWKQEDESDGN